MNDTEPSGPAVACEAPPSSLRIRAAVLAVLTALGVLFGAGPPARADSASGGDLQVAQTLGERELTVILRRVTGLPGPLHVDVLTHAGTAAGTLRLRAVPTGASADRSAAASAGTGTSTSTAEVSLGSAPGSYSAVLRIERAGPWELVIGDGRRTARIPFVVPAQTVSPPELMVFGGFVAAGVLILVTVLVAVRARRGGWTLVPAGGTVAALTVAVTAALLSASLPPAPDPGQQVDPTVDGVARPYSFIRPLTSNYSRPPASLVLRPFTVGAGEPGDLRISVLDGSTGLPADDLLVHDGALMHLLVIGPSGELWHLHPVRTGRGAYEVGFRPPSPGHYAVSAEFARRGGGVQQVRSASGLDIADGASGEGAVRTGVGGPGPAPAPAPEGLGTRSVNGVRVRLSAPSLTAGEASVLTARIGDTATLQPWLGMVGHMIVVGPLARPSGKAPLPVSEAAQDAQVWSHAHSMGGIPGAMEPGTHEMHNTGEGAGDTMGQDHAMGSGSMSGLMPVNGDSAADETVAAYGPDASFVYTFPAAGHYRVWIQAERNNAILTIPYLLNVTAGTGSTR